MVDNFGCHTPKQPFLNPAAAMGRHGNEVDIVSLTVSKDFHCVVSVSDMAVYLESFFFQPGFDSRKILLCLPYDGYLSLDFIVK